MPISMVRPTTRNKIEEKFPRAELIELQSQRDFFEQESDEPDALLTSAEAGAAWTLLYPDYEVIVPQPVRGLY